jgi:hypothetical protein
VAGRAGTEVADHGQVDEHVPGRQDVGQVRTVGLVERGGQETGPAWIAKGRRGA